MGLQRVGYDRAYTHVTVLEAIFWILVPAPACHMDISNRAQYFKCSCPAWVNKDHAHLRSGFCWSGHLAKNTPSFVFAGRVVLPSRSPRWCYLSSVSVSFLFFLFFLLKLLTSPCDPQTDVSVLHLSGKLLVTWWVMSAMSAMLSMGNNPYLWVFENALG